MPFNPLEPDFFDRDTLAVARDLLGCRLELDGLAGRIVETEAYATDAASHAVTTPARARLMRETSGYVYVYLIYGMYCCLNFTSDANGPGAVLIRALEPLEGIDVMRARRGRHLPAHELAAGPGKLCRALGIDLSFNGERIGGKLRVLKPETPPAVEISPRVGITKATDLPWRFYIPGNRSVSFGGRKVQA